LQQFSQSPKTKEEELMAPILFTIGQLQIRSYYVFLSLGAIVGCWIGWMESRKLGYSNRQLAVFFAVVVPLALLMGLANGVFFSRDFYWNLAHGQVILAGGMVSYGIVFSVFAAVLIFHKIYKGPLGKSLDVAAVILPVMLGFTRIGCFLNGCCYGRETDGFGGISLPNVFGLWDERYPTQLLLLALDIALFTGLWLYRRTRPADGSVAIALLFWFGLGRLLIDSLRDLKPVLGPFGFHQLMDMAFLIGAVILYAWRRPRRPPVPAG
jgi:phosphatidylglycerol---prolipoprotein diacylglyceryl transferase